MHDINICILVTFS